MIFQAENNKFIVGDRNYEQDVKLRTVVSNYFNLSAKSYCSLKSEIHNWKLNY